MSSSSLAPVQLQVDRYGLLTILIFGNIGNVFIMFLFKNHWKNPCAVYLMSAAVTNILLLTFNIPMALYSFDYGDPASNSMVLCKLRPYLSNVWSQMGRYFVALAYIDRLRTFSRLSTARYLIGILKEGKLLNQEFDAQRMAEQLRSCLKEWHVKECAVRLYSAESFLYKLINSTLRTEDWSKIDTLGPFCYLLWLHEINAFHWNEDIVYRGVTLKDKMLEEYKQAVGTYIIWPAYTSTSLNRQAAEQFGNTLFIIKLDRGLGNFVSNISSLSHYPHEQEVLLACGYRLKVDKVERELGNEKYLIHLSDHGWNNV
ncbi:unnamed protein product [Adineta steineri]|uniref:G-protein coupled receptors family 1 profile domain-containing protein n=1 Tax=Adineta steineri TaxID=433720 RepID=A0A815HE90_9BILA|nr:unnamed protein product [Adineta steineri]